MPVVNDRTVVRSIPAVHCIQTHKYKHTNTQTYPVHAHTNTLTLDATTALSENSAVGLHTALTAVLVASQVPAQETPCGRGCIVVGGGDSLDVRVMGGGYPVVAQRTVHVHVHIGAALLEDGVPLGEQEVEKLQK